jgi:HAD superfamily hydrolase (TIGR01450 family)
MDDQGAAAADPYPITPGIGADWAFDRYEAVRDHLPAARFADRAQTGETLLNVAPTVDGFVLDAFGVLNVGATAIPGAVERMAALRAMGKKLVVLTNGASQPRVAALAKYGRLGFDFVADEVVSSRDVAAATLAEVAPGARWGAAASPGDDFADLPVTVGDLRLEPALFDAADGFVLLSSQCWDAALNDRLANALSRRPRPVVVANPDMVAPHEAGFSMEPGHFGHVLRERLGIEPIFVGKPYPAVFDAALSRMGLPPERVAMVGDTLHTDVLGGAAAGMRTVLIAEHGLFKGLDVARYVDRSGIVPDFILRTT